MQINKSVPPRFAATIALAVLFIALPVYYTLHRPFDPSLATSSLRNLLEILRTLALVFLGGGLGAWILPNLSAPPLARLALRAAFGLGLMALAILLIGSTLGLNPWLVWGITLTSLFALRKAVFAWARDGAELPQLWNSGGRFGRAIAVLGASIFLAGLATALAPPLKFDALVYHLTLPKLYIDAGRLYYVDGIIFWGFPQIPHMLMTWLAALGSMRGAMLVWSMGLLCSLGLFDHLRNRLGPRPAWGAIAALLAGTSLAQSLGWAYMDWPSLLFAWALLFALDEWGANRDRQMLLLAGAFAGMLFGVKYTAGLIAALGGIYVFLQDRRSIRTVVTYSLVSLGFAATWLVRNALTTANPLYPLLFPGGAMDAIRLGLLQGLPVQGSWLDLVFLPFRATFLGIEGGHLRDAAGYETSIGPLLLAFSLFAGFAKFHLNLAARNTLKLTAFLALGTLLVWGIAGRFSGHLIRTHLYFAAFPAFAALSAFGFASLQRIRLPYIRVGRLLAAVSILALALSSLQVLRSLISTDTLKTLIGQTSEEAFLEENLGLHALVMRNLREELPPGSKVLMLWEARGYYCVPICEPDEIIDRWVHDLQQDGSPEAVLEAWRGEGFSHVLYYSLAAHFVAQDADHFHPVDVENLEASLSKLNLLTNFDDIYLLYSLNS
ncbi:MAG: hypothetical protein O3B43_05875 [Chloroflexi bacterium]|nr:hypothetical protein [Chloroflexota bacterium]